MKIKDTVMRNRRHFHSYVPSTLLPSGGPGNVRPRVDKLQTLEAKMASIEVSLGWKRRREALLETLPRAARDLVRELDALHQALREKDGTIQSLKTQITNLGGTVGGGGEGGAAPSEAERRSIQERLNKVQTEMEAKKVAIKNLKLALEKTDITDNIDVRIRAAELEYELVREELNILSLKEESSVLGSRLQDSSSSSSTSSGNSGSQTTLHALLTSTGGGAALGGAILVAVAIPHTPGNPPFHVTPRPSLGCVIDWATDDTRLRKGDRLVEVNGESVVGRGLDLVTRLMAASSHLNLVVARPNTGTAGRRSEVRLEKQLEDRAKEIKDLVSRLDKALREKETLKSDNTRLNHRISYLEEQVSELQTNLNRTREAALKYGDGEAIVTTSQPGATVIQVFQKGDQKLAVASPEPASGVEHAQQYPTLPRLRSPDSSVSSSPSSSSCTSSSEPNTRHTLGHINSRPPSAAESHRRVLSPRPDSKNEDSRPPSRTKPVPPKKPERLSVQRNTSLQSVDESPSPPRSATTYSRYNTLQTWPSIDNDIDSRDGDLEGQTIYERRHEKSDYPQNHDQDYDAHNERSHYGSREKNHDHYMSNSYSDGSVRMVIGGSSIHTEGLHRRLSPQGQSAPKHEAITRHSLPRSHSPDAAVHLDSDAVIEQDADIYRAEVYNPEPNTAHFSKYSHQHKHNHQHSTQHNQYSLQTPLTSGSTSRSSGLSIATTRRPHEQWC